MNNVLTTGKSVLEANVLTNVQVSNAEIANSANAHSFNLMETVQGIPIAVMITGPASDGSVWTYAETKNARRTKNV